jgi:hypothetical protein
LEVLIWQKGNETNVELFLLPRLSAHTPAAVLSRMVRGHCPLTLQSYSRVR